MADKIYSFDVGKPIPLGTTVYKAGVNFSLFSEHAESVELLIFDNHNDEYPCQVIKLEPKFHKTFHFWHIYIKELKPGAHYAYRVDGPFDPVHGHRFNKNKVLIDPYSKGNCFCFAEYDAHCTDEDNVTQSIRSCVPDILDYDWEGDMPLHRSMNHTIIYEIHVKGFTASPSSGVKNPGTFSGVIEKIPYLKELGVTAVELLPVFAFDDVSELSYTKGTGLTNFWGYNTVSFFSPHSGYCVDPGSGKHVKEFRNMVKALHKEGIEVILDVVFNHTYEGDEKGPTYSFKGIDNSVYYILDKETGAYLDFSGCGNSLNCNHPIVEKFIIDCLRYWVKEMHVDGFRFDEASVLSRGEDGKPLEHPPVLWQIELDDVLFRTKVIAEAWDSAGLYQVGYFPGYRWAEWNGRFRDDVRKFVKGEPGLIAAVAQKIAGSSDLYKSSDHQPINSINFITAHDGFTLNDLVSYNDKHNEANGENGNDGSNNNFSWNCGIEGQTVDLEIEKLRQKQIKNYATILMISQGIPMITAGDEIRRTQQGNNNAYCQNNQISWFDWDLLEKNTMMFRFWKELIAFRKRHPSLRRRRFFTGKVNKRGLKDISWYGVNLEEPNWNDLTARAFSFTLGGLEDEPDLHVMMNMYWEPISFELPEIKGHSWHLAIDTSLPSPDDIHYFGCGINYNDSKYEVNDRSIVILSAK